MAEYYPLLAKAVASLPDATPEARHAIYERARQALFRQLRNLEPPIPEADVERESRSLEAAVAQLETEFGPAPEIAGLTSPDDDLPSPGGDLPGDAIPDKAPEAERTPRPAEPQSNPPPSLPLAEAAEPAPSPKRPRTTPVPAPPFKIRRGAARPDAADLARKAGDDAPALAPPPSSMRPPKSAGTIPPLGGPPQSFLAADKKEEPQFQAAAAEEAAAQSHLSPAELGIPPAQGDFAPGAKTRPVGQRPLAPQPMREAVAPRRFWFLGAVLGLVVAVIAIAAFISRETPEDLARQKAALELAPAAQEPAATGKIVERIGAGAVPPAPVEGTGASEGDEAAKTQAESGQPPASAALRAALLVEAPDEKSKVKTYLGSVVWKVDNVSNGPGEPLSTAVHADVDIPEEKFQAAMTLQKNLDGTLPASHTMNVRFVAPPDGPLGVIQQISVPQMRREDTATGAALAGIPVPIMENSFLVGLSRGNAEAANLDLLRTREWVDVPMVLSDGRIAKLTFEKGRAGQRAIDDALGSWQAQ
jgi:hypothetical protein